MESTFEPHARPAFQIEEESPDRRLVLVWQGGAPRRWLRLAAGVFALLLFTAAALFAHFEALPAIQKQGQPGGDPIGETIITSLLVVGAFAIGFYVLREGGKAGQYVERLTFDAGESAIQIVQRGRMIIGRRRTLVPLHAIRSLTMTIGSDTARGGPPIAFSISYELRGELHDLNVSLPVVGVTRRTEAMELLFRIARITDHPKYLVLRSDPRELRLSLLPKPGSRTAPEDDDWEDEEVDEDEDSDESNDETDESSGRADRTELKVFEVPRELDAGAYRGQGAPRAFVEPQQKIPPLDLDALSAGEPSKLIEWDPPRRLHTTRDAMPRSALVVVAVVFFIAAAIVGAWPFHGLASMFVRIEPSRWQTASFLGMVGAMLGTFLVWAFNRQRDVVIDPAAGTIDCRQGEMHREYSCDEVCEVALVGQRRPGSESSAEYRCTIELGVGQDGEWVFDSGEWQKSSETPYRILLPLSIEVARMLGVPWRWQDYRDSSSLTWFRQMGWKERGVVVGLLASVVGYLILSWAAEQPMNQARDAVRASGLEVSFLNGYHIQNELVLADFWQVKFTRENYSAAKLAEIAPELARLDRVGLYLGETGLVDADLAALAAVENLLLLELYSTPITNDGLSSLAPFHRLVYLTLAATPIDDAGLARLPPLESLRFLNLSTTRITDAGLRQLLKFPRLTHVSLYNLPQLSEEALDRLRQERPKLTIGR